MNVHANESENHKHGCGCHSAVPSVHQSLEEIDFERGIWSAAVDGDIEKVRKFLNKGVQPSIRDSSGYTALHYAARNGHKEICEELLQKGANPNAQTTGGATPLHRAALQGHSNIVSLLLNYKADPTLQDSDGKNSLHKAAAGGHIEIAKVLVKMNESLLNQEDNKGLTPAKYASFDNPVLLEILQAATVS